MANNKIKVYKWIDIDKFKLHTSGTYLGTIDWKGNFGNIIDFIYGDIKGKIKILKEISKSRLLIEYNDKEYEINKLALKSGKLGGLFGQGGITKQDILNYKNRVGEYYLNKYNIKIEIIKYESEDNIIIRMNNDIRTDRTTTYREFKKKNIVTPFDKTICNIGHLGIGNYKPVDTITNKPTKEYDAWRSMIRRCYAKLENCKSYIGCSVCEEWLCFQNFAKWFDENYYIFRNDRMQVDKDILKHGNRIYSPNTCLIVPNCINCMFVKNVSKRGNLPIGVYKNGDKYRAECSNIDLGFQKDLGMYNNPIEAFESYKNYKEKYIVKKANDYKDEIPEKVYEALIKYRIDIND